VEGRRVGGTSRWSAGVAMNWRGISFFSFNGGSRHMAAPRLERRWQRVQLELIDELDRWIGGELSELLRIRRMNRITGVVDCGLLKMIRSFQKYLLCDKSYLSI